VFKVEENPYYFEEEHLWKINHKHESVEIMLGGNK
jgi:hypothetical protein